MQKPVLDSSCDIKISRMKNDRSCFAPGHILFMSLYSCIMCLLEGYFDRITVTPQAFNFTNYSLKKMLEYTIKLSWEQCITVWETGKWSGIVTTKRFNNKEYQWLSARLVAPVLVHWSYHSLVLSHWYIHMAFHHHDCASGPLLMLFEQDNRPLMNHFDVSLRK